MRKYTIINASEVNSLDFELLEENSASTMRFSTDENKAIASFIGETPSFLEGKTQYTQAEMKVIVSDVNGIWYTEINF